MSYVVVLTDGAEASDRLVIAARRHSGGSASLVLLTVLSGGLVAGIDPPSARGRARRRLEDEATERLARQLRRVGVQGRTLALFGDPVDDTILLTANLDAEAVVVAAEAAFVDRLRSRCPVPVFPVSQAEAPE
ncbi:MAG: hypothetical protein R3246_00235 [Acidimicrobiia bacterium]|nr:hypothetical protein [Acidimicrobiia bacterium]